jgi:hypothetical protein
MSGTLHTGLSVFNPLKPQLNPICYLLAFLGAHHILHVNRIRVNIVGSDICRVIIQGTYIGFHGKAFDIYYIVQYVHQQYKRNTFLRLHGNTGYPTAPQCCII